MIDLHCHVLPGLDDGARTPADSLAIARLAERAGTSTLLATPHIDRHWGVDPLDVGRRVAALGRELRENGVVLELRAGGEVDILRLASLTAAQTDAVRLGGGPYLLLESPLSRTSWDFDAVLLRLRERGEAILLAHPERCPVFQREPERLERLVAEGVLCSITAGSMWGQFGETVRRFTIELLSQGLVHDVASDAHDPRRRPPGLGEAFASAETHLPGLRAQADWLTRLVPAAILAGEPLPPRPPLAGPGVAHGSQRAPGQPAG